MSLETMERTFSSLFSSGWLGDELSIVWHAGEPFVLPIEYYASAFRKIASLNTLKTKVQHCFQTNAMLIDDSWCRFFKKYQVEIGVSIDGPEAIHDKNRVTRSGSGTYSQAIAGIRCLKRNNVKFSVISVLSASSLEKADELYQFYVNEEIDSVAFNVEEIEGANRTSSLADRKQEVAYRDFMRQFWNLNIEFKRIAYIREFKDMLDKIINASTGTCIENALTDPLAILSVDYHGNLSTFSPEFLGNKNSDYNDFILGNFATQTISDIVDSDVYKRLCSDISQGVKLCRKTCDYFPICGGGSPVNKLYEKGTLISSETMYCRLNTKVIADLAIEIFEAATPANPS